MFQAVSGLVDPAEAKSKLIKKMRVTFYIYYYFTHQLNLPLQGHN